MTKHTENNKRMNLAQKLQPPFNKLNRASSLSGRIRSTNEDFQVDEIQQFTPSGDGEHVWLKIKKTGENTEWVAKTLAQIAEVPRCDVSFAGMKDRNAITTQWFSVQMPGREAPNWQQTLDNKNISTIQIIEQHRHHRKLKRGALTGNQFNLTLRKFKGSKIELDKAILRIKEQGVPNYYGSQRFGHSNLNIDKAQKWFLGEFRVKDRNMRSIYLSAARSWIFNHILSARVADQTWNIAVQGDVYIFNGSNASFSQTLDVANRSDIQQRLANFEIHPSGALWGRGKLASQNTIAELEAIIANQFKILSDGLEKYGLQQQRRALRLLVSDLEYKMIDAETVLLEFSLPAGAYATSVLAELGEFE